MKININKIGWILLIAAFAAIAVFIICGFFSGWENDGLWRVFSVCIPVAGVCFTGTVTAAILDHTKRR